MGTIELDQAPSLRGLFAKAAAGMLPGRGRAGDELPDTELVLRGVQPGLGQLADYVRVCHFPLRDTLPATYPHVLAFPLALSLMTGSAFPFPAAGVVHVANRITQHRRLPVDTRLDLAVHAQDLRPHARGRQVDLVSVASVDGEVVWRDVSTYLRKELTVTVSSQQSGAATAQDGSPVQDRPGSGALAGDSAAGEPTAVWPVAADTGPAYARVSGDRNPIHTSALAARAFGFRKRIAHGMWTKARCLAQLGPRLPEAYEVEVSFQAPILLPSTVHFLAQGDDSDWSFAVQHARSGKPHLVGTITTR